jgi:hypothetical protein
LLVPACQAQMERSLQKQRIQMYFTLEHFVAPKRTDPRGLRHGSLAIGQ